VDPVGFALAHASQPTTQDLLNAINDLSKKISQLSKNQQTLASSLDQIGKTVTANYLNIQKAANYINGPTAWYAYWVVGHPFPESDTPLAGWANP
jgi:histidinol dehydrogenase